MPSTAQTLLNQAVSLGYDAPSLRDLKEALLAVAQAPASGAATAQDLATTAGTLKFASLSERHLFVCLAGVYAALTNTTAQQAVVLAAANHYGALSDDQLDKSLLALVS